MHTKVSKWGNSLAVRIPAAIAEQVNITCGTSWTDEHRHLSSVIQVACPLVEHRHFDQFGDVVLELCDCLCLIRAEDEGGGLATVVGIDQQIMTQDE